MALYLQFQMGADRYVLDVAEVAQVVPLVAIKQIPGAPHGIAGIFDFHGRLVPVIDLSELAVGRPAARLLSTRVILAHYRDKSGRAQLLGLLAEKVTQTIRCAEERFVPSGVTSSTAPYLGPVAGEEGGLLQRIEMQKLLPDAVSEALFQPIEGESEWTGELQRC